MVRKVLQPSFAILTLRSENPISLFLKALVNSIIYPAFLSPTFFS